MSQIDAVALADCSIVLVRLQLVTTIKNYLIYVLTGDVKRGQNLEAEARATRLRPISGA